MYSVSSDWIQKKLSDLATHFDYGLNASAKKFDGKNKYLRITDIDEETRSFILTDLKSPSGNLEGKEEYLLESGDITFARTGASVGKSYLHDRQIDNVYFAGFLIRIRPISESDSKFIFYNTLTSKYRNFVKVTSMRSGQPGINAKEFQSYKLYTPKNEEQEKIGNILKSIDNIITLEQEKLNKLKNLNDQILRMFIYRNWKYSLNYSKSTQQFEKVTLNRILKETNNKTTINNQHEILSSTNDGLYLQSEYFKRQVASKNNIGYKILERNQLVLSPQNLWLGNINFNDKYEIGIVSPSYKTFDINTDFNKYFIGRILSMKEMEQKYMSASEQGASVVRRNLNIDEFNQISLFLPDLATQNFISEFIQNIEDNIYKRSINIEKYSQIKTTLLSEMFV